MDGFDRDVNCFSLVVSRQRGGVVVRERDLPDGQDDMALKVDEGIGENNGKRDYCYQIGSH